MSRCSFGSNGVENVGSLSCVDIVRPYQTSLNMVQACKAVNVDIFCGLGNIGGKRLITLMWITYSEENGERKSPKFPLQSSERHPTNKAIGFGFNLSQKEPELRLGPTNAFANRANRKSLTLGCGLAGQLCGYKALLGSLASTCFLIASPL